MEGFELFCCGFPAEKFDCGNKVPERGYSGQGFPGQSLHDGIRRELRESPALCVGLFVRGLRGEGRENDLMKIGERLPEDGRGEEGQHYESPKRFHTQATRDGTVCWS